MVEIAIVRDLEDEFAIVEVQKSEGCSKCGACSAAKGGQMIGKALNLAGAEKGDLVFLELNGSILRAASVVYLLPVALLFLGYYAGATLLGWGESAGVAGAMLALAVSFFVVIIYDRRSKSAGRYQLMVKRIKQRGANASK